MLKTLKAAPGFLRDHWGKTVMLGGSAFVASWLILTSGFGYHGPTMQAEQRDAARTAALAEVCQAQFAASPNAKEAYAELTKNTSDWDREKVVEKYGWDKVLGQSSNAFIKRACGAAIANAGPPKVLAQKS